ncbi:MAG TPA: AAA family ATPase [Chthonomonadales bacterium]|nr:AAA family ATPase [Chthonomonadales bacterium]
MGTVLAVVNQKGGVGKTTTAVSVSASIAELGWRVLLVDLDPQGHATSGLGMQHAAAGSARTVYDVLIEETPVEEALVRTAVAGLDLVRANIDLAGAELELIGRISRETCLARALAEVRDAYDFVLIDCPPALGLLTVNGLAAADRAIIPIQCEYYALEGVSQLLRTIELVRRRLNPALEIGLVVLTMYDPRAKLAQQVASDVRANFGDRVAETVVPRNVRLSESPSHGLPITLYDARSRGARAYRLIAQEVIDREQARAR